MDVFLPPYQMSLKSNNVLKISININLVAKIYIPDLKM